MYGESGDFIAELLKLNLRFVVAIRDNHAIWVPKGTRQRHTRWRTFERVFSNGTQQTRYIAETIFGKRTTVRYFWLTTDKVTLPKDTT
jgi:SRSO17 transposase